MRRTHIIALAVFLVIAGGILSLSPKRVQDLQTGFLNLLSPFLKTGSGMQLKVAEFTEGVKTLQQLEAEVRELRVENNHLKASNQLLRDLSEENERFRAALGYIERSNYQLLPARVISRDSSTWWNTVKINRGSEHGIEPDMAVLTDQGLVGKTTTVGSSVTVVLLLVDESCKVAANVQGTPAQGILAGSRSSMTNKPSVVLGFLSRDADLTEGQRVYSSGVGGVFPPGIFLGTVKDFEIRELQGQAEVVPAVDFGKLQDVFVVLGDNRPQAQAAE